MAVLVQDDKKFQFSRCNVCQVFSLPQSKNKDYSCMV